MSGQSEWRGNRLPDEGGRAGNPTVRHKSMQSACNGFSSLSHELLLDGRRQIDSLDEQIYLLGANCPKELREARDEVAITSMRMNAMLEGYGDFLASWTRRFA